MDEKEIFYKLLMTGASVRLRKIYDLRKEKYFEEVHVMKEYFSGDDLTNVKTLLEMAGFELDSIESKDEDVVIYFRRPVEEVDELKEVKK